MALRRVTVALIAVGALMFAAGVLSLARDRIDQADDKADQLTERVNVGDDERAELRYEIELLRAQIEALGGQPVTSARPSTSTPSTTPEPASPAVPETPVTNPAGKAPPGQQEHCTLKVLRLCV